MYNEQAQCSRDWRSQLGQACFAVLSTHCPELARTIHQWVGKHAHLGRASYFEAETSFACTFVVDARWPRKGIRLGILQP